jgi:hypothetical protein
MYLPFIKIPFRRYERNHEPVINNIFLNLDRNVQTDITKPHGVMPVLRISPQPSEGAPSETRKLITPVAQMNRVEKNTED